MTPEERKQWQVAYDAMMQSDAWKDLERYADDQRQASMLRTDTKPAAGLSLGEVCEERGIRKGIVKIIQHAQFRQQGI